MTPDALNRKIDTMIAAIEREQLTDPQQWDIAHSLIGESLNRKFAILDLPAEDYSEQCTLIDQELEQSRTPEDKAILARFRRKFPCTGAKEQLLQRLSKREDAA